MQVNGVAYRTIWFEHASETVGIIDQTKLPHEFVTVSLRTLDDAANAISAMLVRGAPLIGAASAWGVYLAMKEDASDKALENALVVLLATRPTAVNLQWALEQVRGALFTQSPDTRVETAKELAEKICNDDVKMCQAIGKSGVGLIRDKWKETGKTRAINIMTHCNAGWLATVDWGTATAPIYTAHEEGIPVHVWVDETRPRNQGASLTAWELCGHGINHTLIADNAGGHLMNTGQVDILITGTDRTAANGDVANKIGTYLKALAAFDNNIPFYVGLPGSTIDWSCDDGTKIPIEERGAEEVLQLRGRTPAGNIETISIAPEGSTAANPAFDVTPARLVTGLITERGICEASNDGLTSLYPEKK